MDKLTLEKYKLYNISRITNQNKKKKFTHQTPVIWGEMNFRLGKARFNSLRILLDYVANSSIVLGKHIQNMWNKTTKPFRWITQGDDSHKSYKSKVKIVVPKFYAEKSITWNLNVNDSQGNNNYNIILRHNILYELKIDLCFSNNTIRGNGGPYERCVSPMKDVTNINFNASSVWLHEKISRNK